MPRFKIVVKDPQLAHEQEIARNVAANLKVAIDQAARGAKRARGLTARDQEVIKRRVERAVRDYVGPQRPKGTVHAAADSSCPDGLPNCRNCGDPAHLDACAAAGHCPLCGTKHGVAPDSVLAANGYELVPDVLAESEKRSE